MIADVRIVAATNRDLQAAIDEGLFRADLYYRLNVFPVEVPPLRERPEDIPLLLEYFVHRYARQAGKPIKGISRTGLDRLQAYRWPGNIRELQNIIERAVIVSTTDTLSINERWLSTASARAVTTAPSLPVGSGRERDRIEMALRKAKGRVAGPFGAAAKLGVPPSTLESKIRSLGIDKSPFKSAF
ncbi:MAG: sigma-54-dependent Fis family transcriptional regulator [Bryobacteraceae bacterium]|nr:sigma-54-dependent Fis family transcriptional regulator [Bryobacteraceae bacterium]